MAGQPTAQIGFFLTMTLDTEFHVEIPAIDTVHGFDISVTFLAGNLFSNVALMIKQHMLGQVIGLFPGCGCPGVVIAMFF